MNRIYKKRIGLLMVLILMIQPLEAIVYAQVMKEGVGEEESINHYLSNNVTTTGSATLVSAEEITVTSGPGIVVEVVANTDAYTLTASDVQMNGHTITKLISDTSDIGGDIIIPSHINGVEVQGIGERAFYSSSPKTIILTSVVIPDSVTVIGDYAFYDNELTSIDIPDSVTTIGEYVFSNNQLSGANIPSGMENIPRGIFNYNNLSTIIIPDSVTSIGRSAFSNNQLTSIDIPDNVTSIGSHAFSSNQLTSIDMPDSKTTLEGAVFYNNQLTSVSIPDDVVVIPSHTFEDNDLSTIVIPDSVTAIGGGAFKNNQLTSIDIPDSVTAIGGGAFKNNQLTSIDIPDSVATIGNSAFSNNQLTSVKLPNGITAIPDSIVAYNDLSTIMIPNSVTTIGDDAFRDNQLTSIDIPDSVTTLGNAVFYDNKLTSIDIPDSRMALGSYLFGNNELISVTIPDDMMVIPEGIVFGNQLSTIVIPDGVTTIGRSAFRNNHLSNIEIPDGVNDIADSAFYDNQLTSIDLPGSVTTIGNNAFRNNQLTSIDIPDGVTTIGDYVFYNNKLTSVNIPSDMENIPRGIFEDNNLRTIIIPDSVTTIGSAAFSNNHINNLTIGNGVTSIGSYAFRNNYLNSVDIPDNVETIGWRAFYDNQYLRHLKIGDGVIKMDREVFDGPGRNYGIKLQTIEIPDHEIDFSHGDIFPTNFFNYDYNNGLFIRGTQSISGDYLNRYFSGRRFYYYGGGPILDSDIVSGGTILYYGAHDVTFRYGRSKYEKQSIKHGATAIPPEPLELEYDGHIFKGWDKDYNNVESDLTVKAVYALDNNNNGIEDVEYTVTFIGDDDSILKEEIVIESNDATPPVPPTIKDRVFVKWPDTYKNVQSDISVKAEYADDTNNNGKVDVEYTVTFIGDDNSILKEEIVIESNNATPPVPPTIKDRVFVKWPDTYKNVQSDISVKAEYADDTNNNGKVDVEYTVTFIGDDNSILKEEIVIESNNATPPVPPTVKNRVFVKWPETYKNVQSDISVKAEYADDTNNNGKVDVEYTVTFIGDDNSILKEEIVIESNNATPPAPPTIKDRVFVKWPDTYKNVQSDISVKAEYADDTNNNGKVDVEYTVTFIGDDDSILKEEIVIESNNATPPVPPTIKDRVFVKWPETYKNVQSDISVKAEYADDTNNNGKVDVEYTVTFIGDDNSILKEEIVIESNNATPPALPTIKDRVFVKWPDTYKNVQSDISVKAEYADDTNNNGKVDVEYTVTFIGDDDSILKEEIVIESNNATPPVPPTIKDRVFVKWPDTYKNVQSDISVKAEYADDTNNNGKVDVDYTVSFIDHDGTVLKTETVIESNNATAPENPTRSAYVFTGWDRTFTNVQSDLNIKAQYKRDHNGNGVIDIYTVSFFGWRKENLGQQLVAEGEDANEPIIDYHYESEDKQYDFTGWDKSFTNIQSNLVVNATFKRDKEAGGSINGGGSVSNNPPNTSTEQSTANSKAYMIGMPDGTFQPEKHLTRAELISLFDRFYTLEENYQVSASYNIYSDVESDAWYYDAVNRMTQKGLVSGYEDGTFRPDQEVTREELAQVVYNHFDLGDCYSREVNSDYFGNCYDDIYNRWSTDALIGLQTRGILQDFSDGSFTPESSICRGETVLILNRYFGYDTGYDKEFTTTFSDIESNSKWSLPVALASKDQLIHSNFISDLETEMN